MPAHIACLDGVGGRLLSARRAVRTGFLVARGAERFGQAERASTVGSGRLCQSRRSAAEGIGFGGEAAGDVAAAAVDSLGSRPCFNHRRADYGAATVR